MPPDQALLHDNRALAASAGFPIRPSLVEQVTVQDVEEPQPALTTSPASEKGKHWTPTKAMYLKTKQGRQGVLQVHQAGPGRLSCSEICEY